MPYCLKGRSRLHVGLYDLHTFSQSCKTPGLQPYNCYFYTPFRAITNRIRPFELKKKEEDDDEQLGFLKISENHCSSIFYIL